MPVLENVDCCRKRKLEKGASKLVRSFDREWETVMHNELEETWIRTALSVMRGLHADAVLLYSVALLPFIGRICNFHAPECEARIPASCNQMITSIIYQFIFSLLYFFLFLWLLFGLSWLFLWFFASMFLIYYVLVCWLLLGKFNSFMFCSSRTPFEQFEKKNTHGCLDCFIGRIVLASDLILYEPEQILVWGGLRLDCRADGEKFPGVLLKSSVGTDEQCGAVRCRVAGRSFSSPDVFVTQWTTKLQKRLKVRSSSIDVFLLWQKFDKYASRKTVPIIDSLRALFTTWF